MSHARAPHGDELPDPGLSIRPFLLRPAVGPRAPDLSDRILDAARDGIIYLDAQGRIEFANPAAAQILGYSVEELLGQPIRTHLQFAVPRPGMDDIVLQTPPLDEDVCWREDGSSFPIECETATVCDDGRLTGTVITFRDISQRRAVEQLKDERISIVSHELRTPLTSIHSALGLLVGGVLETQPNLGRRMLEIAATNTERLIRLVNDMLDLERLESGNAAMRRIKCDTAVLLHEAANGVGALADDAGVSMDIRAAAAFVCGDPDRLVQVFTNLLSNAIKFSPQGGATVWVESEVLEGELIIRVRDEGRGIPAQMLESIFDRFKQVEENDAREKGGSGLGLAICRGIVLQHDGQIWAESTVGAGTTMCVALPCFDGVA